MGETAFTDKRLRALLYTQRIKVVRALIKLQKGIERGEHKDLPGPYLSKIAEEANLNKRSTSLALQKLEDEKIVAHKHVPHFIRGRLTSVKVYKFITEVDWIERFLQDIKDIVY